VLTLIKAKNPATQKEGFDVLAYKIALRAYISSLATSKDTAGTIKKAKDMMDLLETSMGNTPQGKSNLVAIYVTLARELQQQLEIADQKSKEGLEQGFRVFLEEVSKGATELNVLYWVAETYRGMGESFLTSKNSVPPQAKANLDKSLEIYNKILGMGKTNKSFLTPNMADSIRMQIAKTYRTLLKYKESVDTFEEILRASPTKLPVQMEAARTYQNWAGFGPKFADYYRLAIVGARPDNKTTDKGKQGKNIIWGWGEIAKMTANNPKYAEQFHEARYNLALCRYLWALAEKDDKARTAGLQSAKLNIAQTLGLFDPPGPKWEGQYDALLKKIQKSLGEKANGIESLQGRPPAVHVTEAAPAGLIVPVPTPASTTAPAVVTPAAAKPAVSATTASTPPAPAMSGIMVAIIGGSLALLVLAGAGVVGMFALRKRPAKVAGNPEPLAFSSQAFADLKSSAPSE